MKAQPFQCRENIAAEQSISFPESLFPLTSGQKMRGLGATIAGMRYRCRLRSELDGQNSVIIFLCYMYCISNWLLPELSFCDRWLRGTKTLGMRMQNNRKCDSSNLDHYLIINQKA